MENSIKPHYFKFKSKIEFDDLKQFRANTTFEIPIWKSNNPNGNVLIMIHGFLEGVESNREKRNRHLKKYESIAIRLAEKGFTSILLPLPFHFDRSVDFENEEHNQHLS